MNTEVINERQLILQLAIQGAYRKRDECQSDIRDLKNKITSLTLMGCSYKEKDKVVDSIAYLQKCKDGWQRTIDSIRDWQDELKVDCF